MRTEAMRQRTTAVSVAGWATVAYGGFVAVLRTVLAEPPDDGLEGLAGSVALGAAVAAPGVVALVSRMRRGRLIGAGAALVLSVPLSLTTVPLLLPGLIFVTHGATGRRGDGRRGVVVALLLAAAVVVLFASTDPRREEGRGGEFSAVSDVISYGESVASLAAAGVAVAVARDPRRAY